MHVERRGAGRGQVAAILRATWPDLPIPVHHAAAAGQDRPAGGGEGAIDATGHGDQRLALDREHAAPAGGEIEVLVLAGGAGGHASSGVPLTCPFSLREHAHPAMNADTIRDLIEVRPARRPRAGARRRWRAFRGDRGVRRVRRQAAAGPPPHGLCHPRRAHGRRDPCPATPPDPGRGQLMQKIVVEGGSASRRGPHLRRQNAVLPILCATLLADAPVRITNVPRLHDVLTTAKLLAGLGAGVVHEGDVLSVDPRSVDRHVAPYELVKTMRASVLVLGRCWLSSAMPRSRCPAVARSARGRWTCTSRACRRWAPRSWSTTASSGSQRWAPEGRAARVRTGQRGRDRERDDGGGARRGHHGARERGDGAGDRRPCRLPHAMGARVRGAGTTPSRSRAWRRWAHANMRWWPTASRPAPSWSPRR